MLVAKNRSSQIGAAPPSGLQKFAAAAVDAASPTRSASTTATPNANANGSSTFKRATPTAQRQAQANAKSGRRLSGAPQEPAPSPHAQRRSQIESEDESTEEADAHVGANIAQKRRSILKAFSGGYACFSFRLWLGCRKEMNVIGICPHPLFLVEINDNMKQNKLDNVKQQTEQRVT